MESSSDLSCICILNQQLDYLSWMRCFSQILIQIYTSVHSFLACRTLDASTRFYTRSVFQQVASLSILGYAPELDLSVMHTLHFPPIETVGSQQCTCCVFALWKLWVSQTSIFRLGIASIKTESRNGLTLTSPMAWLLHFSLRMEASAVGVTLLCCSQLVSFCYWIFNSSCPVL